MIDFKTQLLPHQEAAVEKLRKLRVGALFMEQGTGKTRTALELINIRLNANKIDKVLWLCPCSVQENLLNDFEKHTGSRLEGLVKVCGIESLSSSVRLNAECLKYVEENRVFLVVDESILVKNFWAKRSKNIVTLSEKCNYKLILNGTPISKNEIDLFGQFYLLDWRILGYNSWYSFAANHVERDEKTHKITNCLNVEYLTDKLAPYTYQIRKVDCLDLPSKNTTCRWCYLTEAQEKHYNDIAETLAYFIDDLHPSTIYTFFNGLQAVIAGMYVEVNVIGGIAHIETKPFFNKPTENPRIQVLLKEVENDLQKTIIFCKYTHEIESILSVLREKYGAESAVGFYGELKQKERQNNLKVFGNNENCLFLVANKSCAGYGLNLQFCHKIIFYSNDWTLGTRLQAEDRVHRIGQSENVVIVDIIAADTIDEQIISCLERKTNILTSITGALKNKNKVKESLLAFVGGKRKKIDSVSVLEENQEVEQVG